MKVSVKGSYEALDELRLAKFEAELNCTLPKAYREFLLTHNGGYPNLHCFRYHDDLSGEEIASINLFFSLNDEDHFSSINYQLRSYIFSGPEGFLPIAHDGGSSTIYISLRPLDFGKIYLQVHWIDSAEGNIFLVSNSFEEFLDSIFACQ